MEKLYREFDKIILYCEENNIIPVVVLFPLLVMDDEHFDYSYIYTKPIENYFKTRNIMVLNTTSFMKDIPYSQRVVNTNDYHPNEVVNKIVAEELYKIIITRIAN